MSSGIAETWFPTCVCPLLLTVHPLVVTPASPKNSLWHLHFWWLPRKGQCANVDLLDTAKWILRLCTAWLFCGEDMFTPLACVWPWIFWKAIQMELILRLDLSFKSAWNKPEISVLLREEQTYRQGTRHLGLISLGNSTRNQISILRS